MVVELYFWLRRGPTITIASVATARIAGGDGVFAFTVECSDNAGVVIIINRALGTKGHIGLKRYLCFVLPVIGAFGRVRVADQTHFSILCEGGWWLSAHLLYRKTKIKIKPLHSAHHRGVDNQSYPLDDYR